jgi:hypothetical protein
VSLPRQIEWQDPHVRATPAEAVEMVLISAMQENVTGLHTVSAGIADFDVLTGQEHRGKALLVQMSWQKLTGMMLHKAIIERARHQDGA